MSANVVETMQQMAKEHGQKGDVILARGLASCAALVQTGVMGEDQAWNMLEEWSSLGTPIPRMVRLGSRWQGEQ